MNKEMIKSIKQAIKELRKSTGYVQVPDIIDAYLLVQKGNVIVFDNIRLLAIVNIALQEAGVRRSVYYTNDRDGKIQEAINYLQGLLNVKR